MKKIISMQTVVGIALVLTGFILGSIQLFANINTLSDDSLILFKVLFFTLPAVLLIIVYLMNLNSLSGILEHLAIVISIFLISAAISGFAANLKISQDIDQFIKSTDDTGQLQAQVDYYSQLEKLLELRVDSLKVNNQNIQSEIDQIGSKIGNKTPIVIENIVIKPAEIIYVDEPTEPIRYEDDDEREDEDEGEDDD